MRKLRPARILSATCPAAVSGLVVVVIVTLRSIQLGQEALDPSAALRGLVILEIELRGVSQADALSQKVTHPTSRILQSIDDLLGLIFLEPAHEHARVMKIGAHVDAGDRRQTQLDVLQIVPEDLHEGIADVLTDAGCSPCLFHRYLLAVGCRLSGGQWSREPPAESRQPYRSAISSKSSFSLVKPASDASVLESMNDPILSRVASAYA